MAVRKRRRHLTPVGQRPAEPHTLRPPGATPGPAILNDRVRKLRQSDQVESLVILWVRLPPRSLKIPWSNGDDTCVTCRRRWFNSIRDHSKGLQVFRQHTAVVRRKTGFNSRADLCNWACMPMEATDPCKIGVMGSTPIRSTDNKMGLMVQREDTAMAWR